MSSLSVVVLPCLADYGSRVRTLKAFATHREVSRTLSAMSDHKLPTAHQRLQISVLALVHPRTVERCYKSLPVRETCALRVSDAASKLNLPAPKVVLAK